MFTTLGHRYFGYIVCCDKTTTKKSTSLPLLSPPALYKAHIEIFFSTAGIN